jgi:predicted amidophosphoribosyltransferase
VIILSEYGFCPSCGKVKEDKTLSHCELCYKQERSDYEKVRDYVRKHPNSNAMDVARKTDVDISKIMKYIKNKALSFAIKN